VHAIGRVEIENGRTVRAFGSLQDITERRRAQEERHRLDAEISEMQRVESIGILAGGIAHDFNNLLTGILGFTRLAQARADQDATLKSHLQQIEQGSVRAADLCKQLLAYAGKGRFMIQTIDLSQLVRETAGLVEGILQSNVSLQLELTDDAPLIEGDATLIRQVVMNLLTNAGDAFEEREGSVRVRTFVATLDESWLQQARIRIGALPGEYVCLEVRDSGLGMDAPTLAKIFDPFFTTKFAGRGLGLAAVLGIVRSHRGAIRVHSEKGVGTTFIVAFPPTEDSDSDAPIADSTAKPALRQQREGDFVLIIDDEESVRALASTALAGAGFGSPDFPRPARRRHSPRLHSRAP
jgi:signal transduction histidine kinase